MKKISITSLLAVGAASLTSVASIHASTKDVFDIQPRAINLQVCDVNQLSLSSIHQMISQRNCRDIQIVRSSADNVLHL